MSRGPFVRNRDELLDRALPPSIVERRAFALDLVEHALDAADAERATARVLEREAVDASLIFAVGKAAPAMARAALARRPRARGLVVTPYPVGEDLGLLRVLSGDHPVPGRASFDAGAEALAWARTIADEDVLCLVSGGASACLELPRAGVSEAQLVSITETLLARGAPIGELNTVRAALSALKNGGLLACMPRASVTTIVLSDVVSGEPSIVGSGPTIAGRPVLDRAREILAAHGIAAPALGEPPLETRPTRVLVAADNRAVVAAVVKEAERRGASARAYGAIVEGEARAAGGAFYASAGSSIVVAGGEPTVRVAGRGRGGRAQELVLGAARAYRGGLVLAFGTDGVDGSSDAAGALFDEATLADRTEIDAALAANDADRFFRERRARIVTGPTGTNVADIALYLP
jgi:hydroxypyruvate reductase